ncbi:hypothetical protein [Rhizobium grahamii]|uniref:Uncharacterized protein n=1 Tax=Rhizobium grahamii TaxID=1120045 RepID=A0A370KH33_9HYPH|nr:hypothetical protein [Rhizobium grahamii]RDJ04254.1 hypothetical protein B5K06_27740 [Rhizobium grahamii]
MYLATLVTPMEGAMHYISVAVVGAGIGMISFWIAINARHFWFRASEPFALLQTETERQFHRVFAIMTNERRQSLLRFYMEKYECGPQDAMLFAVEDRERDIRRCG